MTSFYVHNKCVHRLFEAYGCINYDVGCGGGRGGTITGLLGRKGLQANEHEPPRRIKITHKSSLCNFHEDNDTISSKLMCSEF